jgi:hypothetical protein
LRSGDILTVIRDPQRFARFGGTGRNDTVPLDAAGMTLEQAIALWPRPAIEDPRIRGLGPR